jgi:hypothetical protein
MDMSISGHTAPSPHAFGRRAADGVAVSYAGVGRGMTARAKVSRLCATTEHQE